ncbi:MAG: GLUG motif-containing protein [Planctomycetota bacterium]|jgi:hypothetical protein
MSGRRRLGKIRSINVLVITVLLAASGAAAKYSGGTGEPNDPYRIATPEDLNDIGNHVDDFNKCFVLVNDINIGAYTYTAALIASDTDSNSSAFKGTPFTGIFDGNDHIISSLTIDTAGAHSYYLGLFGKIAENGEVKTVGIEDVNVRGGHSYPLGGLCGENRGTIYKCHASGSVDGRYDSDCVGGLCGENWGTIINCWAGGSVSGDWYLGSLCGSNYGTINHCYATGSVSAVEHSENVGGLCGQNTATISSCYSSGSVTGADYSDNLGGLCGENYYGTISNCYTTSPVTGGNHSWKLGGLCGSNYRYNATNGTISNCYSSGSVTGGDYSDYVGGLCGRNSYGAVSNCYSIGPVSRGAGSASLGGLCGHNKSGIIANCYFLDSSGPDNGFGTPLTDVQMKQQNSFTSWDFVGEIINGPNDVWTIQETLDYPKHVWELVNLTGWYEVDFLDYAFFAERWGQKNCPLSNDCDGTDLDFSGAIDWRDLKILCDHWLEGVGF